MAGVETTTIRVRRVTHERLQKQAEITGQSVTQVLEEAADLLEEAKMLESAEAAWERMGEMTPEEVARAGSLGEKRVREIESLPPLDDQD